MKVKWGGWCYMAGGSTCQQKKGPIKRIGRAQKGSPDGEGGLLLAPTHQAAQKRHTPAKPDFFRLATLGPAKHSMVDNRARSKPGNEAVYASQATKKQPAKKKDPKILSKNFQLNGKLLIPIKYRNCIFYSVS